MNIDEAMKILNYKINMHKEDVFIGDLDKTNIKAIQVVLKEIERLNNIINKAIEYIERDLSNLNIQENIVAKNELLQIKNILKGDDNV